MTVGNPNFQIFAVKRQRKDWKGRERWVEIGRAGVNIADGTGFIEMHINNETWRMFRREKKPSQDDE